MSSATASYAPISSCQRPVIFLHELDAADKLCPAPTKHAKPSSGLVRPEELSSA